MRCRSTYNLYDTSALVHFGLLTFLLNDFVKLSCVQESANLRSAAFCGRDFDLDPMTLKLKSDLDILKVYTNTKKEAKSRHSKMRPLIN